MTSSTVYPSTDTYDRTPLFTHVCEFCGDSDTGSDEAVIKGLALNHAPHRNCAVQGTPGYYRAEAAIARKRSADSWERSDTDGFLSQWASDVTAREYDLKAELAEAGNVHAFWEPVTLDGQPTGFRQVETRYGYSWVRGNSHDGTTEWFNPSEAKSGARRLAADTKKGYVFGHVLRPAHVELRGNQTSVSPCLIPDYDTDVEPVVVDFGAASGEYNDREW